MGGLRKKIRYPLFCLALILLRGLPSPVEAGEVSREGDNASAPMAGSLRQVVGTASNGDTVTFGNNVAEATVDNAKAIVVNNDGVTVKGNVAAGFALSSEIDSLLAEQLQAEPPGADAIRTAVDAMVDASADNVTKITGRGTQASPAGEGIFAVTAGKTGFGLDTLHVYDVHRLGGLNGGGLVGSGTVGTASTHLGMVADSVFSGNSVGVSTGAGLGGGLIGSAANVGSAVVEGLDTVVFSDNSLDASGGLNGGGIVGAVGYGARVRVGDMTNVVLVDNSVNVGGTALTGGGLIGAAGRGDAVSLGTIAGGVFSGNTVSASGDILGGGLLGVAHVGSPAVAGSLATGSVVDAVFAGNTVTAGGEVRGGGLIGAYSANGANTAGLGNISGSVFSGNKVSAAGDVAGALVSGSAAHAGGVVISDSRFVDNAVESSGGAVMGGAVAVDTSYSGAGNHVVTLAASAGKKTVFSGNTVKDIDGERANSLFFGDMGHAFAGSAVLNIDAATGGRVELHDPLRVKMTGNPAQMFVMNIGIGGTGEMLWGGRNVVDAAGGSTIAFTSGSTTHLAHDFGIESESFALNIKLAGGSILTFDPSRNAGDAMFDLTAGGSLTVESGAFLKVTQRTGASTSYLIASGASLSGVNVSDIILVGNLSNLRLENGDTQLWVTLDGSTSGALVWTGAASNVWDTVALNWSGTYDTFAAGDAVTFDNTATEKDVLVGAAGVTVSDMTVSDNGYVFAGGKISGSVASASGIPATGKLVLADGVAATFATELDFTGGIDIGNGSTLVFDVDGTNANTNVIAGDGAVRKTGDGVLTLGGASGYAGGTRIDAGMVIAANKDALGAGAVSVGGGAFLELALDSGVAFANNIGGLGSLVSSGSGRVLLTGHNDFQGGVDIRGGTLAVSDGNSLLATPTVAIAAGAALEFANAGALNFAAGISGAGRVVQTGTGITTVSGANSHTGGTEIRTGVVVVGNDAAFGQLAASGSAGVVDIAGGNARIVFNGDRVVQNSFVVADNAGVVSLEGGGAGTSATVNTASGRDVLVAGDNSTVVMNSAGGMYLNGGVSGGGEIRKTGSGALQIAADSLFGGKTDVQSGSFRVAGGATFGDGGAGSEFIAASGSVVAGRGTIRADNILVQGTISPDSSVLTGDNGSVAAGSIGPLTLGGGGTVTLDGVTMKIDLGESNASDKIVIDGTLAFGGMNKVDLSVFGSGTFTILEGGALTAADLGTNIDSVVTLNGTVIGSTRVHADLSVVGGDLVLTASSENKKMTWTNDAGNAVWDYDSVNWTIPPDDAFVIGDYAVFDATATGGVTVRDGGVQASGMLVDGGDHTFTGGAITTAAGEVDGVATDGKLVIQDGSVSFENASNAFTGGIELAGGGLGFTKAEQLGDGGKGIQFTGDATLAANAAGVTIENAVTVAAGKTAVIDTSNGDGLTLKGAVGGSGNLNKAGSGVLNLANANSGRSGATTVSGGTLRLVDAGGLGSGAVSLSGAGAVLEIANAATVANAVSGGGMIRKTGSGTAVLSGSNSHTGGTSVEGGLLNVTRLAALGTSGQVSVSNDATLGMALSASDISRLGGVLSRTALSGSGILALSAASAVTLTGNLSLASASSGTSIDMAGPGTVTLSALSLDAKNARVRLAAGTDFHSSGASSIRAESVSVSGNLHLEAGSVLSVTGGVAFAGGSFITLSATTASDIGKMKITGSADFEGTVRVHFGSEGQHYIGQTFLAADGGLANTGNLKSDFYALEFTANSASIREQLTFGEIQDNLFGPNGSSVNLITGAGYIDGNMDSFSPAIQDKLKEYVQLLDDAQIGSGDAYVAFRQLYGEYAAYSMAAHRISQRQFVGAVRNQLNQQALARSIGTVVWVSDDGGVELPSEYMCVGPATTFWGGAFGAWADQNGHHGVSGYEYSSGGGILGVERNVGDRLQIGFAAAYTRGKTDVADAGAKYTSDMAQLGVYANYLNDANEFDVFLRLGGQFGYGWHDYRTNMVLGGHRKGEFDTLSVGANVEAGLIIEVPMSVAFNVVPAIGLDFARISRDGWTESGQGAGIPLWVKKEHENIVDMPVSLALNHVWHLPSGGYIVPEARAAWVRAFGEDKPGATVGFAGSGAGMRMVSVAPGGNRWQVGGGVKARFNERVDAGVDYRYEFNRVFKEHALQARMGLSF